MSIPSFYDSSDEKKRFRTITGWIVDIVVVLSLAALAGIFFFQPVGISGRSMEPYLSNGDKVFLNTLAYTFGEPERLDVIYFETTDEEGNSKSSVKRILGLPGETIQIKGGHLYINGQMVYLADNLDEAVLSGLAENEIILGPDEYFVLGDNRDNSEDSRFRTIGNIKRSEIKGNVWFRIQPLSEAGLLKAK